MTRAFSVVFLALLTACSAARRDTWPDIRVEPAQVVLIRHGEKPDKGPELNERGRQRAEALVKYVLENPDVAKFGPPAALYAQAPTEDRRSRRSVDTLAPLAAKLNLEIRKFDHDRAGEMVREIQSNPAYAGRTVLIAWQHEGLTEIAELLGVPGVPDWKGKVFDRTWIVNFPPGAAPTLRNLPQRLLEGDSPE